MPKTIMAPSQRIVSLGIILLLVCYSANSLPPPAPDRGGQTGNEINQENSTEKTVEDRNQEQEQSKLGPLKATCTGVKSNSFVV